MFLNFKNLSKRRLNKAFFRLKHLPSGINLIKYFINKFHAFYLKLIKSTKVAHPSSIMFEVTNHCNLKCITCPREYIFGDEMDKGFMSIEGLKKIVDEAFPYVDSIGLTGLGETMMYKPLNEAIDYIKSKNKGIVIFISINAHLPKSIDNIKKLIGKIDTIQISIDGLNDVYNQVRLEGEYNYFINNVKEIVAETSKSKTYTDVMFNVVVIQENYKQMSEIVQVANDIGVKFVNFQAINLTSIPKWDDSKYNLYSTKEFKIELVKSSNLAKKLGVEMTTYEFGKQNDFQKCSYPWNHFYITWDGLMTPCCAKPFPKILNFGNVFKDGLMTALNSRSFQDFRKKWYKNETPEFCERCHFIEIPKIDINDI